MLFTHNLGLKLLLGWDVDAVFSPIHQLHLLIEETPREETSRRTETFSTSRRTKKEGKAASSPSTPGASLLRPGTAYHQLQLTRHLYQDPSFSSPGQLVTYNGFQSIYTGRIVSLAQDERHPAMRGLFPQHKASSGFFSICAAEDTKFWAGEVLLGLDING